MSVIFLSGRAIIIDLSPPMDMGACVNIKQVLSGVLSTLAHLTGPCRLPLLSIFVVRSYTEVYRLEYCIYYKFIMDQLHACFEKMLST